MLLVSPVDDDSGAHKKLKVKRREELVYKVRTISVVLRFVFTKEFVK